MIIDLESGFVVPGKIPPAQQAETMNYRGNLLRVVAGVVLLWLGGMAAPAQGQIVRPPELSMQYHRAEAALKSGTSLLEAKARVDRVLEELPEDAEARKLRAEVLIAMGRPEEALEDARRAVELSPGDGGAYLLLSEAARLCGNTELAIQTMDKAAEYAPDDAPLHVRLSWNAMELGQLEKAEAFARIALALRPNDAAAYQQLARAFILQSKNEAAAEILARGLRSAVIPMDAVKRDTVLVQLLTHPLLSPFTGQ
jgi:tetratricopeptide (TPR) repeat protein